MAYEAGQSDALAYSTTTLSERYFCEARNARAALLKRLGRGVRPFGVIIVCRWLSDSVRRCAKRCAFKARVLGT